MDFWDELRIHAEALATAVDADKKFFASVRHYVLQLQERLRQPEEDTTYAELALLASQIEEFFAKWRPSDRAGGIYLPPRQAADADPTIRKIQALLAGPEAKRPDAFDAAKAHRLAKADRRPSSRVTPRKVPCVFIGHGRSKLWARMKIYLEDELGLATVTYESEPRAGESIVPVLEKLLSQATFAVLVLTAEDETSAGTLRARQNVVHEAGLFQGRLGFPRAVILRQEGVEDFSNVAGLQYISFSGDSIEQAFYELQRTLKREGQLGSVNVS